MGSGQFPKLASESAAPTPARHGEMTPANALAEAAALMGSAKTRQRRYRTRELVGLLMAHGSRAMRLGQPPAFIRLRVDGRAGAPAVRMCLPR